MQSQENLAALMGFVYINMLISYVFFFYCISLRTLLLRCERSYRRFPPDAVWFLPFPIVRAILQFFVIRHVYNATKAQFRSYELARGNLFKPNSGIIMCVLDLITIILIFSLKFMPVSSLGKFLDFLDFANLILLVLFNVFWIGYWSKVVRMSSRLETLEIAENMSSALLKKIAKMPSPTR